MNRKQFFGAVEEPVHRRGQTKVDYRIGFCLDPVKVAISRLSDSEVEQMDRNELVSIVKISGLDHMCNETDTHLQFADEHRLRMLACLARCVCQRAIHSAYIERGQPSPFLGHVAVN